MLILLGSESFHRHYSVSKVKLFNRPRFEGIRNNHSSNPDNPTITFQISRLSSVLPKKKPKAHTAVVWLMLAKGCAGGGEETPRINKPFSHIAERRVFFICSED